MQGRLFFCTFYAGKTPLPYSSCREDCSSLLFTPGSVLGHAPPQKAIKESSRWPLDILVADLDKVSMALTLLWVLGRGLAGHVRAGLTAVILPHSFGHTASGV